MKVGIISFYLMESTIPLAKYISLEGIKIDLYSLLPHDGQNTFVFDFIGNEQPNGFVNSKIRRTAFGEKLNNYLGTLQDIQVFIFPSRRIEIFFLKDLYYAYLFATYIKKKKYDLIHIIHSDAKFWFLLNFFLKGEKIIQTLHEVTSHNGSNSPIQIKTLNWLIENSTPIIFHSNTSMNRFLEYSHSDIPKKLSKNDITMIRFGLFETYHCFSDQPGFSNRKEEIKILYFGRIVPYKGIDILIDAVKILQNKYPIHLIIAGDGTPYFSFKNIKSYDFINKHITNKEIANLIESSDIVVLPYTSASQSGVPMTVYLFNKPIIASNIGGLKEVIEHLKTGLLVDTIDAPSLSASIDMLVSNTNLREEMIENIKRKYNEGEFSWPNIAKQTLSFYRNQLEKNKIG